MCDEHVDVWGDKWKVARKEHACCECGRQIKVAEKYYYVSTLYEGSWDNYSMCMGCNAHWQLFKEAFDGCIQIGGLTAIEDETQYDVEDRFVLLGSNAEECMKEQYAEDNGQFGVGA